MYLYMYAHIASPHAAVVFARFRPLSALQTRDWPLLFVTLAPPLCFDSRPRRPPLKKKLAVKSWK